MRRLVIVGSLLLVGFSGSLRAAPARQQVPPAVSPALVSTVQVASNGDAQGQTQGTAETQSGSNLPSSEKEPTDAAAPAQTPTTNDDRPAAATPAQQPKRILGMMPNFRAVSAGTKPPPPTAKQAFILAAQNSFDYSSFVFVGMTSALAEWTDAHPQLGQGMPGYGRYYWRGFVDKTDGNYWVIFVLPTIFHQDERYYAMGQGGFWKRLYHAGSEVLITPNYQGHNTFNVSELLGRGIAEGISVSYYPSQSRTAGAIGTKFGYAVGRDALTMVFREFWPDIAVHVLHRSP